MCDELLSINGTGSFIFWHYDLFSLLQILLKSCVVIIQPLLSYALMIIAHKHLCFSISSDVVLETDD